VQKLTLLGMYRDLLLTAQNAMMFNTVGSDVWRSAHTFKQFVIAVCGPYLAEAGDLTPAPPSLPTPVDVDAASLAGDTPTASGKRRDKRVRDHPAEVSTPTPTPTPLPEDEPSLAARRAPRARQPTAAAAASVEEARGGRGRVSKRLRVRGRPRAGESGSGSDDSSGNDS
jgi:hypothetical protein